MERLSLKDNIGRILGTVKIKPDGKKELYDSIGRYLGSYDPKENMTRDNVGVVVGYGDLLTTLLKNN